jgi:ATP-dependent RNA helicase DDX10/DBP4
MLLPSEEEGMMNNIEAAKIPITRIKVNPAKAQSCSVQFQNMCAADQEIKHLAQKACHF